MNAKYQVFISSTSIDLKEERQHVLTSVLRLGHIPIGMEFFNAANQTQWELIKRRIEDTDYYVIIIAHRYGSIEPESGLSYTEREYDYAVSRGVPTYAFILDRSAAWPADQRDKEPKKQALLEKFIQKVEGQMRSSWTNKDDLATNVTLALNEAMAAVPRVGWVRATQAMTAESANEIARLSQENAVLREKLNSTSLAPVLMPDFSLNFEISWEILRSHRIAPGPAEWGYVLHGELKNIGTAASQFTEAVIQIPPHLATGNALEMKISNLNTNTRMFLCGMTHRNLKNLSLEAVEHIKDEVLTYSIRPDVGAEKTGQVRFADIPIKKRRRADSMNASS